jgi:hypothetical protein
MNKINNKLPERADIFTFTPRMEQLFNLADLAHKDFMELYGVPMQTTSSSAELTSRNATIEIGPHTVFLVGQRYYDSQGPSVLHGSIRQLEGKEKSSILMIIERPLRIVPEHAEDAMLDNLAIALATEANLTYHLPPVSLTEVSVVEEAISLARQHQIDRIDVLGSLVNQVAHPLNMGSRMDVTSGVQVMKDIVPDDVGIIDLYRFADRTLNLEGPELDRLSRMIDNAAISSGYVDENGNAFPGGLYVKEILSDILRCRPQYRDDILGFAVCSASNSVPSADIGRAIMACCDAWGRAFEPLILHDGAISMAEYVYGAPSDDLASLAYMQKIDSCLQQAKINHISKALSKLAQQDSLPQHIFILASLDIAPAYPNLLEKLRKS